MEDAKQPIRKRPIMRAPPIYNQKPMVLACLRALTWTILLCSPCIRHLRKLHGSFLSVLTVWPTSIHVYVKGKCSPKETVMSCATVLRTTIGPSVKSKDGNSCVYYLRCPLPKPKKATFLPPVSSLTPAAFFSTRNVENGTKVRVFERSSAGRVSAYFGS